MEHLPFFATLFLVLAVFVGSVFLGGMWILALGLTWRAAIRRQRALLAGWRALAQERDLSFDGSGLPRLAGVWQGVRVEVRVLVRGARKNQRAWTRVTAYPRADLPPGLHVRRAELLDDVSQKPDARLVIRDQDVAAVAALLQPLAARETVRCLLGAGGALDAADGCFLEKPGRIADTQRLREMLDIASAAALALDEAPAASASITFPLGAGDPRVARLPERARAGG